MISLQNVCECFLQNVPWFLFLKNVLQILSLKKVFPDSLYKTFLIYLYKTFFDLSPWKRKRFSVTSYNVSPHFSLEIAPCTLSLKTFVSSIFQRISLFPKASFPLAPAKHPLRLHFHVSSEYVATVIHVDRTRLRDSRSCAYGTFLRLTSKEKAHILAVSSEQL